MYDKRRTDILIRNDALQGTYVLVDGHSRITIGDHHYQSFKEAVWAARKLAGSGTVWRENVDSRGRPLGAPSRVSAESV